MPYLDRYYNNRYEMKTGDLLLWHSSSALGWIIQTVTKSPINHAGIIWVTQNEECNQTPRRLSMEALSRGFIPYKLSNRIKHHRGNVWWHRLRSPYDFYRRQIWHNTLELCTDSKGYDFKSLFLNLVGYVSPNSKRLFCSEAVYLLGKMSGLPVSSEWDDRVPRPGDLLDLGWWYEDGVTLL